MLPKELSVNVLSRNPFVGGVGENRCGVCFPPEDLCDFLVVLSQPGVKIRRHREQWKNSGAAPSFGVNAGVGTNIASRGSL